MLVLAVDLVASAGGSSVCFARFGFREAVGAAPAVRRTASDEWEDGIAELEDDIEDWRSFGYFLSSKPCVRVRVSSGVINARPFELPLVIVSETN